MPFPLSSNHLFRKAVTFGIKCYSFLYTVGAFWADICFVPRAAPSSPALGQHRCAMLQRYVFHYLIPTPLTDCWKQRTTPPSLLCLWFGRNANRLGLFPVENEANDKSSIQLLPPPRCATGVSIQHVKTISVSRFDLWLRTTVSPGAWVTTLKLYHCNKICHLHNHMSSFWS